ncbi:MAG: 1-(5-phosphoribosyl)-5-[(5-phosphoribosylamino)methylideneamino]imidazole-4-carboxamide isomerase [Bacillota bacterium]
MLVIPAIDLKEGQCVMLFQGDPAKSTTFSHDPIQMAKKWAGLGAPLLHLVDLDGAFSGMPKNFGLVKKIMQAIEIPVQLGGGIRSMKAIENILDQGVERIILGTVAISDPDLTKEALKRYGDRILIGIDATDGLVAVEGWGRTSKKTYLELGREVQSWGANRIIFTDTKRDGTLKGPNIESSVQMAKETGLQIIASGGVSSIADLLALKKHEGLGIEGVIVGKAIYQGNIDLGEAFRLLG